MQENCKNKREEETKVIARFAISRTYLPISRTYEYKCCTISRAYRSLSASMLLTGARFMYDEKQPRKLLILAPRRSEHAPLY